MAVSIRPAAAPDAPLILAFIRELAEYERLLHVVRTTLADVEAMLFAPHPRAFCDIAEVDGEPVGFAFWFYNLSTFEGRHGLYLEDLYVRPAARGQGAGKALLAHLAARCLREGLARMEWAVLDWNAPSIAFYRKLGAVPMDEWTTFRLTGDALDRLGAASASRSSDILVT